MTKLKTKPVDGFINLDKPSGFTSHDCVAKLRRLLKIKKIGHGGTLDPAAMGVLPMAVGRATRLIQYLPGDKAYEAVIRFGLTTTTDDLAGEVCETAPTDHLTLAHIQPHIPNFVGNIEQMPPRYSAIQVQGKRLYDLARRGEGIDAPLRRVTVHALEVLDWRAGDPAELSVSIACGKGTYIRAIARDLGQAVGTGATLAQLIRTQSSGFVRNQSVSFAQLATQLETDALRLISPAIALQSLPQISLTPAQAGRWYHGQKIPYPSPDAQSSSASGPVNNLPLNQPLRVATLDHPFIGMAQLQRREQGIMVIPKLVFHPKGS